MHLTVDFIPRSDLLTLPPYLIFVDRYAADLLAAKSQPASFQALLAAELSLKLQHPVTATSLALSYPIAAAYAVPGSVSAVRASQSSTRRAAPAPASAAELVNIPGVGMVEKRQIWLAALGAIGLLYLGAALGWLTRKMGGASTAAHASTCGP